MKLSEAAVFRWLVIVVAAAAAVIAVTLLTRPLVGDLLGLVFAGVGLAYGYAHVRSRN